MNKVSTIETPINKVAKPYMEGLGFNLCVALSCIVVSLILEDGVGSEIGDLEMTSSSKTEVRQDDKEGDPSR